MKLASEHPPTFHALGQFVHQQGRAWLWASAILLSPTTWAQSEVPQAPVTHQMDTGHTSIYWEVLHMGTSTARGRFDRLEGRLSFNPKGQELHAEIRVDTGSVSTGLPAFDRVLTGPNLLAVTEHPQAVFRSLNTRWKGEAPLEVQGNLTLLGVTQPMTLTVIRWKCGFNLLFRAEVCGGDMEATLARGTFGLDFGAPWVADEVKLRIQIEAVALPPEATPISQ
jgi:polyisoprenoid-binding protein YceI